MSRRDFLFWNSTGEAFIAKYSIYLRSLGKYVIILGDSKQGPSTVMPRDSVMSPKPRLGTSCPGIMSSYDAVVVGAGGTLVHESS
jgi:hypothetical protein